MRSRPEVAILVYEPLRKRRKDNTFDGNDNIGARVIEDALTRAGIEVGYCTPATAALHRLVLVSLTSTYDVYAYYRAVALIDAWQPKVRRFKVLAGGFGMQNPTAVRSYVDYAFFGRAHDVVVELVATILCGGEPAHPSLMRPTEPHSVTIHQAPLYPHEVAGFKEQFTGCPLKCKFCHYTWAREHSGNDGAYDSYVQTSITGGGTPELTWDGVVAYGKKAGRIRVAIDGFSERLRYIYGKPISRDDIIMGIERIGRFEGTTTLLVYNISNMPDETDADREELYETLRAAQPRNRVIFVLHSTPFRPSIATPMQWEPVSLLPDWSKLREGVIVDRPNLRAVHSYTLESPWSHLLSVVAERATPASDELFHAMAFAPAFQRGTAAERLRIAQRRFDLHPYLRAYDPAEQHPAWFLAGYVNNDLVARAAVKMRAQVARSNAESGWLPSGTSMVRTRLQRQGLLSAVVEDYAEYGTVDIQGSR